MTFYNISTVTREPLLPADDGGLPCVPLAPLTAATTQQSCRSPSRGARRALRPRGARERDQGPAQHNRSARFELLAVPRITKNRHQDNATLINARTNVSKAQRPDAETLDRHLPQTHRG